MVRNLLSKAKSLHEDQQGATMVEYVLIFAAIALPLLAVLIFFKDKIVTKVDELLEAILSGQGTDPGS